jgi:hypothetical protein
MMPRLYNVMKAGHERTMFSRNNRGNAKAVHNNRANTNDAPSSSATSWESRAAQAELPREQAQFARFDSRRSLVIALGNGGAAVLNELAARIDDTNTAKDSHVPRLLHIAFSGLDDTWYGSNARSPDSKMVERIDIIDEARFPTKDEAGEAHWKWLNGISFPPGSRASTSAGGRVSGRVALYRHLMQGVNCPIRTLLRNIQKNIEQVFLVVTSEPAGASVTSDIAALIRLTREAGSSIPVHVVYFENSEGSNHASVRALDYLELAAWNSEIRLSWRLAQDLIWNAEMQRRQLVTSVQIIAPMRRVQTESDLERNVQMASQSIWGMLTSPPLAVDALGHMARIEPTLQALPTLSLINTFAALFPVRFYREILALRLVLDVIGDDISPSISVPADIDWETYLEQLESLRDDGLLRWMNGYELAARRGGREATDIRSRLVSKRRETQTRLENTKKELDNYINKSVARVITINPQRWKDQRLPDRVRTELLDRVGFVRKDDVLWLYVTGEENNRIMLSDAGNMARGFDRIVALARMIANNESIPAVQGLWESFANDDVYQDAWLGRFVEWQTQRTPMIPSIPPTVLTYRYQTRLSWTNMSTDVQSLPSSDDTLLLQLEVVSRMHLKAIRYMDRQVNLNHDQLFGSPLHRGVMQLFVTNDPNTRSELTDVHLNLQSAFQFPAALVAFAKWWAAEALHTLPVLNRDADVDAIRFRQARDWEDTLWRFIRYFEQQEWDDPIRTPPQPISIPALQTMSGTNREQNNFARYLYRVLEKLNSAPLPSMFAP